MEVDPLASMARFTEFLLAAPEDGDAVARAVVLGPGAEVGAEACLIYGRTSALELTLVGAHGYLPEDVEGFTSISDGADLPVARVVATGEPLVFPLARTGEVFPHLVRVAAEAFRRNAEEHSGSTAAYFPLVWQGVVAGVVHLLSGNDVAWSARDDTRARVIAAALSLWATTLYRGPGRVHSTMRPTRPRTLTEREVAVLGLVAEGKSNAAIAARLGYSLSTVKADISHILTVMGVSSRRMAAARAGEWGFLPPPRERD